MLTPALEKLLIFQDRDQKRVALEAQVRQVPDEIAAIRRKIEEEKAALESAKSGWREAEARRKALETEIGGVEQKIARFKAQQLEVRKNDEYRALGSEIEHAEAQVKALEEEEIKILYALDDLKVQVKTAEAATAGAIRAHEDRIRLVQEKETALRAELETLQAELSGARSAVPETALAAYSRLTARVPLPVCVPLREHKCTGCHLKVSSGVESEARAAQKLVNCDNCGRIVFWEG